MHKGSKNGVTEARSSALSCNGDEIAQEHRTSRVERSAEQAVATT